MFCQHRNIGVHSINGMVECPDCFQQVRHPWAIDHIADAGKMVAASANSVNTLQDVPEVHFGESGIEREARERESDWPRRMGVGV